MTSHTFVDTFTHNFSHPLKSHDNGKCIYNFIIQNNILNQHSPGLHNKPITSSTVLPAKSDSDVMLCLQSYQGLIINRSLVY